MSSDGVTQRTYSVPANLIQSWLTQLDRSRKVVGYGLSKRLDYPLALAALHSAIENRKHGQAAFAIWTMDANTQVKPTEGHLMRLD